MPFHITAFPQKNTFFPLKPLVTEKDSRKPFFKNSCRMEVNLTGITQVLTYTFVSCSDVEVLYCKLPSIYGANFEIVRRQGCKSKRKKEEGASNECMEMVRIGQN